MHSQAFWELDLVLEMKLTKADISFGLSWAERTARAARRASVNNSSAVRQNILADVLPSARSRSIKGYPVGSLADYRRAGALAKTLKTNPPECHYISSMDGRAKDDKTKKAHYIDD